MKTNFIIRAGAAGMVVSGLVLAYSYIAHPHHMTPETIGSPFWVIIHALFALSLIAGLMGTTAIYAPTAERAGAAGLAGFVSLFVGMMLIFGLNYYEMLIAPYLATHYPQVIVDHGAGDAMGMVAIFFPLAGLMTVAGYALLAWAWLRTGVLPQTVALALIVASIAFGVGLSPLGGLMTARLTAAAFGASLVAVGVTVWWNAAGKAQRAV